MKPKYLLDTHAFVFAAVALPKLGAKARHLVENAGAGEIAITPDVITELGRLLHLDKLKLDGDPMKLFAAAIGRFPQVPMTLAAALKAPALALPHSDPHDRNIVASALDLGVPLITKDGNITDSGIVATIW